MSPGEWTARRISIGWGSAPLHYFSGFAPSHYGSGAKRSERIRIYLTGGPERRNNTRDGSTLIYLRFLYFIDDLVFLRNGSVRRNQ